MTESSVDKKKVTRSVMFSWFHTIFALFIMTIVMGIITIIAFRFGKPQIIISILGFTIVASILIFLFSEFIITTLLDSKKATMEDYSEFIEIIEELCTQRGMYFRPRLYILEMKEPNAMAFGPGFLGQYGIAITPKLYKIMSRDELKSVLAHELAHIRCKDVGLNTILSIMIGGIQKMAQLFVTGKTSFGTGPFAYILGGILYIFARLIFPIGHSAISQEREKSADALAALYVGTPDYLISGLNKLETSFKGKNKKKQNSILDKLLISHPEMDYRIECLEKLKFGVNNG
ncbi:M48 family metalloprotease [bacterium]|nr:M48 family metalloprotease [bacterium]